MPLWFRKIDSRNPIIDNRAALERYLFPAREERPGTNTSCGATLQAALLAIQLPIGAYLTAVAIYHPAYAWVSWFGFLPVFLAIKIFPARWACGAGALWGACIYACASLYGLLDTHAVIPPAISMICVPALYTMWGAHVTRRLGFNPVVLALGWVAMELAFEYTGSPIGLSRTASLDASYLHVIAQIFGYALAAFVVAFVNTLLLSAIESIHFAIVGVPVTVIPTRRQKRRKRLTPLIPRNITFLIIQPRAPPLQERTFTSHL